MNIRKRINIFLIRLFQSKLDNRISKEERCLMIIVCRLLNMQDSILQMTPNMTKIYIRKDDIGIFVVVDLNSNQASVINHKFGYDLKLSQRVTDYIIDNFSKEAEKRRADMENTYRNNVQNSLVNVINRIKYETQTDCQ